MTPGFWVLKLLTTGMGETTSDFLVHRFDPPRAAATVGAVFLGALALQVQSGRLYFLLYWLVRRAGGHLRHHVADATM